MVVHLPDSGFSSISIASSSELAITPISITHIASESVVQCQQQRLAPHKQPFSNWADGVARHTGTTFAHPRKHHPCANSRLSRTETQVTAHKHIYTLYCVILYYNAGWFYFGFFPSHQRGFFPGNLKGHWVPKFSIVSVGPQPITRYGHYFITLSTYTDWPSWGVSPWALSLWDILKGILEASAPKRSEPMQPWEAPC